MGKHLQATYFKSHNTFFHTTQLETLRRTFLMDKTNHTSNLLLTTFSDVYTPAEDWFDKLTTAAKRTDRQKKMAYIVASENIFKINNYVVVILDPPPNVYFMTRQSVRCNFLRDKYRDYFFGVAACLQWEELIRW